MMEILVMLLVFAGAGLAGFVILSIFFSEEKRVARILKGMSGTEAHQTLAAEPLLKPFETRIFAPVVASAAEIIKRIGPKDYRDRLTKRLVAAGNPRNLDADRFFSIKVLMVLLALAIDLLVLFFGILTLKNFSLLLLVSIPAAFLLPDIWLSEAVSKRKKAIRKALPDALDMLMISVEAGLGFDAAIARLIKNTSGPLARELARMLYEINAGTARSEALKGVAERADVSELNTFITSMVQADLFGISMAQTLRTQAEEMRVRRRQHAEELAQKAPVKIVFPLVLCILPATLIVIAGPAFVSIGRAFGIAD